VSSVILKQSGYRFFSCGSRLACRKNRAPDSAEPPDHDRGNDTTSEEVCCEQPAIEGVVSRGGRTFRSRRPTVNISKLFLSVENDDLTTTSTRKKAVLAPVALLK